MSSFFLLVLGSYYVGKYFFGLSDSNTLKLVLVITIIVFLSDEVKGHINPGGGLKKPPDCRQHQGCPALSLHEEWMIAAHFRSTALIAVQAA